MMDEPTGFFFPAGVKSVMATRKLCGDESKQKSLNKSVHRATSFCGPVCYHFMGHFSACKVQFSVP